MGERVKVESEGEWYTARIVQVKGGEFKVHYIGYGEDEDTWVKEAAMKPVRPFQYAVGTKVEVLWKKKWLPGDGVEGEWAGPFHPLHGLRGRLG